MRNRVTMGRVLLAEGFASRWQLVGLSSGIASFVHVFEKESFLLLGIKKMLRKRKLHGELGIQKMPSVKHQITKCFHFLKMVKLPSNINFVSDIHSAFEPKTTSVEFVTSSMKIFNILSSLFKLSWTIIQRILNEDLVMREVTAKKVSDKHCAHTRL